MIPGGMNPAQISRMMKQLGIKQEEVDATEVIIKTPQGNIVVRQPSVMVIEAQGKKTFQVMGNVTEESAEAGPQFTDDDVKLVMEKTGKSETEARNALESTNGDLTEAIMKLT
ncbi:MAG: nascent polypeptide-associated complex protein [DPANN group archaeon]|nr:nascent polypeptide-associated complex protein [DPANN group archaeon]